MSAGWRDGTVSELVFVGLSEQLLNGSIWGNYLKQRGSKAECDMISFFTGLQSKEMIGVNDQYESGSDNDCHRATRVSQRTQKQDQHVLPGALGNLHTSDTEVTGVGFQKMLGIKIRKVS